MDKAIPQELKELITTLNIFEKMYEKIRLVDPLNKTPINYSNNTLEKTDTKCYSIWNRCNTCDNCISMRAFYENDTFVKMEYTKDKVYLITAVPITIGEKRLVIEMLKDVTNSMMISDTDNKKIIEVRSIINDANQAAVKDSLTALFNRRFINERLPADIVKSLVSHQPLTIIFTDIDYFKKVNDAYGHMAGDFVLKSFSEELLYCTRKETDWVSRYGGEEFLICLPNTNIQAANNIAERMRKNIERKILDYKGTEIKITASFGVCSIDEIEDKTMESLIELADKKLYKAKASGRNMVIV